MIGPGEKGLLHQEGLRRSKRLPTRIKVRWVRRDGGIDLEATDISLHGMFLRTDYATTPGSLLQLVVMLPTRAIRMFVTARFVGSTMGGHGIGLEIFLMDELDRRAWRDYYRAQLVRSEATPVATEATAR